MAKNFLRILVCPLDWGIGHATRCVPIIKHLLAQNHKVIIAADGHPLKFLREYFPDLEFIRFPGIRIAYPQGNHMILKMMIQSPSIFMNIYKENRQLKKIIINTQADVVISDNRFGLWSDQAYSVYITHQVMIKTPWRWTEPLLYRFHQRFIRRYDECWIPDLAGENNLSGDLGHKYPVPQHGSYIGLLSRFEKPDDVPETNPEKMTPDLLILLSGPEPQRTIFENLVLKEVSLHRGLHVVVLQGLPGEPREQFPFPGVVIFNHLPDDILKKLIGSAGLIICRPGYSTLMDLVTLGRNAVLVPTPGQTEQEYLASEMALQGSFICIEQKDFNISRALQEGKRLPASVKIINDPSLLKEKMAGLVEKIRGR